VVHVKILPIHMQSVVWGCGSGAGGGGAGWGGMQPSVCASWIIASPLMSAGTPGLASLTARAMRCGSQSAAKDGAGDAGGGGGLFIALR